MVEEHKEKPNLLTRALRQVRRVFDRIEGLLEKAGEDAMVREALEADLGLPPGALNRALPARPQTSGIDEYINAVDPSAEQIEVATQAIETYVGFWKNVFEAAKAEDTSLVVDELVYQLIQTTTVQMIKFEHPTLYAVMRVVGVFQQNIRLAVEEVFAPEVPANMFTGKYFDALAEVFERNYRRFRLEQRGDIVQAPNPNLPPADLVRQRQLDFDVFWKSDGFLLTPALLVEFLVKKPFARATGLRMETFYGWELPPRRPPAPGQPEAIPLADHIASRANTLRITVPSGPAGSEGESATLTQLLLADVDGRLGWLLSLRGAVEFSTVTEDEERPRKITVKIDARDGLDVILRFSGDDRFSVSGPSSAGLKITIEPVQTSAQAPKFSIPVSNRTRLEIGDFAFSIDVSTEGLKIKGALRNSAFVIVPRDADSFAKEALGSGDTRIEFDIGATLDTEHGFSFDGGGKLATSIAVNKSIGPVTVRSVELSLAPHSTPNGSELGFTAVTSLRFKKGPFAISVEQIGLTVDAGSTTGTAPDDALKLLDSLLYLRNMKFKPPNGIGIVVQSDTVTGGGFLFHDAENERYAGVFQLEIANRLSVKAVGLLSTRLPDGKSGFSLLIIASVELDPPLGPFLGVSLFGGGVIIGVNRTMDANALRTGLRNRVLDSILFPADPVANAGRVVTAVGTVFPPARGQDVFGLFAKFGFGSRSQPFMTLELALVWECGDTSKKFAVLGQLHVALPKVKPILELHVDGVGIWDRDEFSLDATLYDSHLGPVTLSGDVALRIRKGAESYYLFSIGGYHPKFAVPPSFPKLERLRINFVDTANAKISLTGYFAKTSNTLQFGAEANVFLKGGPISLECVLGFDVLVNSNVVWIVEFDIEIKIKFKSRTLFGVDVHGRFFGATPKRVVAELEISLWLFSIGWSFDHTWGDEVVSVEQPVADPLADLVATLRDPNNWSANLPPRNRTLVSLRERPPGPVRLHPLGGLEVRQAVVPLGIQIERYAGNEMPGSRRFDITGVSVGGAAVPSPRVLEELFAPADFLRLTDDEKLASPSFEALPAGVAPHPEAITFGGQTSATAGHAAASTMDFDDTILGAGGGPATRGAPRVVSGQAATVATEFGPAARSPLRHTGSARFEAPPSGIRLRRTGFVVASKDDLTVVPIDGAPAERSFTAARQALRHRRGTDPTGAAGLQVVSVAHAEGIS